MLCQHTMPGWPVVCQLERGHLGKCQSRAATNGEPYSHLYTWESEFDAFDLYFWAITDFRNTLENAELSRETRLEASDHLNLLNHNQNWSYKNGKTVWLELAKLVLAGYKLRLSGKQWQVRKAWQNGASIEEDVQALHTRKEADLFNALSKAMQSRIDYLLAPAAQ